MPKAPSFSPVIKALTYIHEENLTKSEFGGSEFGGYPSLRERNESYDIRESMSIHCGYDMIFLFRLLWVSFTKKNYLQYVFQVSIITYALQ